MLTLTFVAIACFACSFFLLSMFLGGDTDMDVDIGDVGDGAGHWLSINIILIFASLFGATGAIAAQAIPKDTTGYVFICVTIAVIGGGIGAGLGSLFLQWLNKQQGGTPLIENLDGQPGVVTLKISSGEIGKVRVNNVEKTARNNKKGDLEQGTPVKVVSDVGGVVVVEKATN